MLVSRGAIKTEIASLSGLSQAEISSVAKNCTKHISIRFAAVHNLTDQNELAGIITFDGYRTSLVHEGEEAMNNKDMAIINTAISKIDDLQILSGIEVPYYDRAETKIRASLDKRISELTQMKEKPLDQLISKDLADIAKNSHEHTDVRIKAVRLIPEENQDALGSIVTHNYPAKSIRDGTDIRLHFKDKAVINAAVSRITDLQILNEIKPLPTDGAKTFVKSKIESRITKLSQQNMGPAPRLGNFLATLF